MKFDDSKLKVNITFIGSNQMEYETEALIDTGASITIIPPEISDLLELEEDKEMAKMKLVTASGLIEVSRKFVKEVRINNKIFKNVSVAIHQLPDPIEIKVLIGMNLIERMKLVIDGKNKEFDIEV